MSGFIGCQVDGKEITGDPGAPRIDEVKLLCRQKALPRLKRATWFQLETLCSPMGPRKGLRDQALAALSAAASQHAAAVCCGHAGTKAVRANTLDLAGLVSALRGHGFCSGAIECIKTGWRGYAAGGWKSTFDPFWGAYLPGMKGVDLPTR